MRIAELDKDLKTTRQQKDAAAERLAELEKNLNAARQQLASLESQIKDKDALLVAATRLVEQLRGNLSTTAGQVKDLRAQADLVPNLKAEVKTVREKLTAEEALALALKLEVSKRTTELGDATKKLEGIRTSPQQGLA